MGKIKIAFVETNCKRNGPIKQTFYIIQHLDRSIFEPILITIWPEDSNNSMIDDYKKLNIPIFSAKLSRTKSIFLGRLCVGKILNKVKPDIVQGVGIPPYRMTLGYKNVIHFVTLRNYCYEDYPDYYGKVVGTIMACFDIQLIKSQIKNSGHFVTCSASLTKMYKERHNLTINYIRNGVDVSRFLKKDSEQVKHIRKKLGLPEERIIFVYSGGLIERKNQNEAIQAFLKMRECNKAILLLLGDGKKYNELLFQYGKYDNIIFAGKVNNVSEYLQASDVYISTSKSEGLPNGVLEAMACGLPVLLSNIPQHLEIIDVDNKCGYCYSLGCAEELSVLMDKMVDSDICDIGNNSYLSVMNNFTAENMSKNYQKLYISMIREGKKNAI